MERMQVYQHVLNTYATAQKAGKRIELPSSIDKFVGVLQEMPDKYVLPVIELVVTCEYEPKVLEAVHKLFRERGLTGKPAAGKSPQPQRESQSPRELITTLGTATSEPRE